MTVHNASSLSGLSTSLSIHSAKWGRFITNPRHEGRPRHWHTNVWTHTAPKGGFCETVSGFSWLKVCRFAQEMLSCVIEHWFYLHVATYKYNCVTVAEVVKHGANLSLGKTLNEMGRQTPCTAALPPLVCQRVNEEDCKALCRIWLKDKRHHISAEHFCAAPRNLGFARSCRNKVLLFFLTFHIAY